MALDLPITGVTRTSGGIRSKPGVPPDDSKKCQNDNISSYTNSPPSPAVRSKKTTPLYRVTRTSGGIRSKPGVPPDNSKKCQNDNISSYTNSPPSPPVRSKKTTPLYRVIHTSGGIQRKTARPTRVHPDKRLWAGNIKHSDDEGEIDFSSRTEKERLLPVEDSGSEDICGLTVLRGEFFMFRFERQDVEVYDSTTFCFKRRIAVDEMTDPRNIASCSHKNCLYIIDESYQNLHHAILRIEPSNGSLIKAWNVPGYRGKLSVASDTHVIVCPIREGDLYEYTADGELVRTIKLGGMTPRIEVAHAVKLDNGCFIVCQSDPGEVFLLSIKETSSISGRIDEPEILRKFSEESGSLITRSCWPVFLSVGNEGSILVSDIYYSWAVLLNSNSYKGRMLHSEEGEMGSPIRTCFDESTGEWLVTDRRSLFVYKVQGNVTYWQTILISDKGLTSVGGGGRCDSDDGSWGRAGSSEHDTGGVVFSRRTGQRAVHNYSDWTVDDDVDDFIGYENYTDWTAGNDSAERTIGNDSHDEGVAITSVGLRSQASYIDETDPEEIVQKRSFPSQIKKAERGKTPEDSPVTRMSMQHNEVGRRKNTTKQKAERGKTRWRI